MQGDDTMCIILQVSTSLTIEFLLTIMDIIPYLVGLGLCLRKAYTNSSLSTGDYCNCSWPRGAALVLWKCGWKNFCQQAWYWTIGGPFLCCRRPTSCAKRTQVMYGACLKFPATHWRSNLLLSQEIIVEKPSDFDSLLYELVSFLISIIPVLIGKQIFMLIWH